MLKIFSTILIWIFIFQNVYCDEVNIPELGTVIGSITNTAWTNKTVYRFLGIPYAEPPIDQLRFKKPVAKKPFTSPFDATQYRRACPNYYLVKDLRPDEYKDAEDCLHLSIYSLNLDKSLKRPVMLFIHGGGYDYGTSNEHTADYLLEKDIVFVAINYRLGPFGFLSTESTEIPGNAGFRDTILAIEWVRKYIQNFGGNPNHITIFGESAGAALVSALMLSPAVPNDYFQGAIMQSGSLFANFAMDNNPLPLAKKLFSHVDKSKCTNVNDPMEKCFVDLDVVSMLKAYVDLNTNSKISDEKTFKLTKDGVLFPYGPSEILNGHVPIRDVPVMAGVTKHEGVVLAARLYYQFNDTYDLDTNTTFNTYDLIDMFTKELDVDDVSGTLNAFLINNLFTQDEIVRGNFTEMMPGIMDLTSDIVFKAPVLKAAQVHAKHFANKTYLYTFDYRGEISQINAITNDTNDLLYNYVHHADDLFYLFPHPFINHTLNEKDTQVAKTFVDLWTSFAIDGVPKSGHTPAWPPLTKYTGPYLHLTFKSIISEDFIDELMVITTDSRSGASLANGFLYLIVMSIIVQCFY